MFEINPVTLSHGYYLVHLPINVLKLLLCTNRVITRRAPCDPSLHTFVSIYVSDATFTLINILLMTADVEDWEVFGVLLGVCNPEAKFEKIKQLYKDPKSQKEAMLNEWYATHPLASWSLLHQALNMKGDTIAAKAVQEKYLKGLCRVVSCNLGSLS